MLFAESGVPQCYPVIKVLMADYFKDIPLNSNKLPHGTLCEAPTLCFEEGK
jgi:hypothetical protein